MEFTGERFVPGVHGDIELEHLHRYLQACEIAHGKVVLDIASGEGYGSSMLAGKAARVIGVDISVEAVQHARERYKQGNLEYRVGSCSDIPLHDASVDMVVSFETIEHHDQHEQMMREFKRVLRPAGILLISSPDKYHYSVAPEYRNAYHVKELFQQEFKQLLGNYFKKIVYFGQRVIHGSGIFAESLATSTSSYWQENEVVSESAGITRPVYWIALAADVHLPRLTSGFFEQPVDDCEIVQSWRAVLSGREQEIVRLTQVITELETQIVSINRAAAERDEQVAELTQLVAEGDARFMAMQASLFWRATSPLRAVLTKHPRLRRAMRRTIKFAWWGMSFQLLANYRRRKERLATHPHFSPPTDDYALAVPFSYVPIPAAAAPSLGVVCHLFFDDMAEEFKSYLSNIPFDFDLYITTDTNKKKRRIEKVFEGWKHGSLEVRISQNRGRDIAPKLITCADVHTRYEYVLHIHSKHSPYGGHVAGWRKYLLQTLLGSPEIVASIFEIFQNHPDIGIIAPQHLEGLRPGIGWGLNYEHAKAVSRRLALDLDIDQIIDFPSGSMFWARSAALKPILNIGLAFDDFPVEESQEDGTPAHAIERLYFHICEAACFDWIKIAQPDLLSETRHRVVAIQTREELAKCVVAHRVRLLEARGALSSGKESRNSVSKVLPNYPQMPLLKLAHENSSYRDMEFPEFVDAAMNLAAGKSSAIDFDDSFYLACNPDVNAAVRNGGYACGYIHYCIAGKNEGRIWSNGEIERRFGLRPALGSGLFEPINARPLPEFGPDLSNLPLSPKPFLLVLFENLRENLFYAGYAEFFRDFEPVFRLFSRIVISVEDSDFDGRLAARYSSAIEVIHADDLRSLTPRPSVIVAFNQRLFHKAAALFKDLNNTVYYCQDFEAGFFPYGAEYVMAERAIANSRNLIISTGILRRFFDAKGLLTETANIVVTAPTIEFIDVQEKKSRKLFFYFRPEYFNSRNLPEILMGAVACFCEKNTGYELYLVGSVATSYSFTRNDNVVFVISKLQNEDYIRLVASCDVVVSLIYSAHPGVIAFQAAGSGIPTITNIFDNRSASLLRELSENFIPYDPVREDLVSLIEIALGMRKGKRSFNANLYGGRSEKRLDAYFLEMLGGAQTPS